MYSAFYDPLEKPRVSDSGLADALREKRVTDVYVVGLAADYCVRATAVDAKKEGFRTFIVEEATKPVDQAQWEKMQVELFMSRGVEVVSFSSDEVGRVGKV